MSQNKMLTFGLIFLIPTATLALNYGNYGSFQNPMRYNDGHNIDLGVKPGSNLIFNFEQLRRDQPPQIEMRDESLGLYMHRPQTTTTTDAPKVVVEIDQDPENTVYENNNSVPKVSTWPPRVNVKDQQTTSIPLYHPVMTQSTFMPSPPPAPRWADFSKTFNRQAFPYYESQKPSEPEEVDFNHFQQPQPSRLIEKPFEHKMPVAPEFNHFQRQQHQTTAAVEKADPANHDFRRNSVANTTPEYMKSSRQNKANRGSHKFSWNDLVTESSLSHKPQQEVSSTLSPVILSKNPPSMPTLTPWLDGFGK